MSQRGYGRRRVRQSLHLGWDNLGLGLQPRRTGSLPPGAEGVDWPQLGPWRGHEDRWDSSWESFGGFFSQVRPLTISLAPTVQVTKQDNSGSEASPQPAGKLVFVSKKKSACVVFELLRTRWLIPVLPCRMFSVGVSSLSLILTTQ